MLLAAVSLSASAQQLRIEIADTALQHRAILYSKSRIDSATFDNKGIFIYNNADLKRQLTPSSIRKVA